MVSQRIPIGESSGYGQHGRTHRQAELAHARPVRAQHIDRETVRTGPMAHRCYLRGVKRMDKLLVAALRTKYPTALHCGWAIASQARNAGFPVCPFVCKP